MTLDKAIKSGKEWRRSYEQRGKPGRFDKTCRPHGGGTSIPCPYCERARLFGRIRLEAAADEAIQNIKDDYPPQEAAADVVIDAQLDELLQQDPT